jgi:hypothetical protein
VALYALEVVSIKLSIGYLKKDFKFRVFFLLTSIFMGVYLYFDLYENGVFIGINDIYSVKAVYIFIFSVVCIFIPWHLFDKE